MGYIRILFLLTLITLGGLYAFNQVFLYKETENKLTSDIEYYNSLFASTSHSSFHEIELLLDMLGNQLLFEDFYKNRFKSQLVMNDMMNRNKALVGFGLTDTEGRYIALSSNIDPNKIEGLGSNEETRQSFSRTINSDTLVPGKVYYIKAIDRWVLPLRKALRNARGEVVGVMTTGIALGEYEHSLKGERKILGQKSILYDDVELWRLYVEPLEADQFEEMYNKPVSNLLLGYALLQGVSSLQISEERIRDLELGFTFETTEKLTKENYLVAMKYNKRYKLWSVTFIPKTTVDFVYYNTEFFIKLAIFFASVCVLIWLFIIISQKEDEKNRILAYQALHDPLTGMYNRSALPSISARWVTSNSEPFFLFFIDLDNFKNINDSFGHSYGDIVLVDVARRLRELMPDDAELVRNGGDEFAIFLHAKPVTSVEEIGRMINTRLSETFHVSGLNLHIGASIGISCYPDDGVTLEQLMVAADLAMYDAKKKRNNYAFYDSALREMVQKKNKIEYHLRTAINTGELYMVFQPQVKPNGHIAGVEALVRWENGELGFVPPDQFISVAENSGLMVSLGKFIIERSIADFSEVCSRVDGVPKDLTLSINVSVKQILDTDFTYHFMKVIKQYQVPTNCITLEITESLFIDELDYVLPLLKELRETGLSISLDDFGTGYSSLSMLRTLPIDELKIDRSFVSNIGTIVQDFEMARSIIEIGHNMNMDVVAEGVEERGHIDILESFGCDIYQGYYYSKPLKIEELINYIEKDLQN